MNQVVRTSLLQTKEARKAANKQAGKNKDKKPAVGGSKAKNKKNAQKNQAKQGGNKNFGDTMDKEASTEKDKNNPCELFTFTWVMWVWDQFGLCCIPYSLEC